MYRNINLFQFSIYQNDPTLRCTPAKRDHQHRRQTFAHARVFVRAELSARTKTEEKYISERLHKALEKRVNKIILRGGKLKKTFF